jgi:hypothetical protein
MKNLVVSIIVSKQFKETRAQEKELTARKKYTLKEKLDFLASVGGYPTISHAARAWGISYHNARHWSKAHDKGTLHG